MKYKYTGYWLALFFNIMIFYINYVVTGQFFIWNTSSNTQEIWGTMLFLVTVIPVASQAIYNHKHYTEYENRKKN